MSDADELKLEVLKTRKVIVMGYYDILENEDSELLFVLKPFESPLTEGYEPRLYYDGGPHAILLKNQTLVVVCDMIHTGVRGSLARKTKVLIGETSEEAVQEEYYAEVRHGEGVEALADALILWSK